MALNLDQIRAIADRVAASYGLDIVDIESVGSSKDRTLRVFIEKNAEQRARLGSRLSEQLGGEDSESGTKAVSEDEIAGNVLIEKLIAGGLNIDQLAFVTHEDCEQFSKDFGTVLDVEELVPGADYTLEVSSPGLDRKLYGRADYERFRGSLVKLQTTEPIQGNRHCQGRINGVEGDAITLDLSGVKQKGKAQKAAKSGKDVIATVKIPLANILKANLVPEI